MTATITIKLPKNVTALIRRSTKKTTGCSMSLKNPVPSSTVVMDAFSSVVLKLSIMLTDEFCITCIDMIDILSIDVIDAFPPFLSQKCHGTD